MHRFVSDEALDALFSGARIRHAWLARPVGERLLRALWELVRLGPTGGDARPARLTFVRSQDGKARLAAAVLPEQREMVKTAPVAAVVLCPCDRHPDRRAAALRDGAAKAAYLIVAARALGLDCGPIWDFDARRVEAGLSPDGAAAAAFLCALGYSDDTQPAPGEERPGGRDEVCCIL